MTFCYKTQIQSETFKRKTMGESLNPNSKKSLKPNAYTCLKHWDSGRSPWISSYENMWAKGSGFYLDFTAINGSHVRAFLANHCENTFTLKFPTIMEGPPIVCKGWKQTPPILRHHDPSLVESSFLRWTTCFFLWIFFSR